MTLQYKAKQLIVMRKDLHMRKGKIAAQAGHACVEAVLLALAHQDKLADIQLLHNDTWVTLADNPTKKPTALNDWFSAGVAKICVYVNSEDELLELAHKADAAHIVYALIHDAGITEFHGEPTYTCLAFEPCYPEVIDPLTGNLPLF